MVELNRGKLIMGNAIRFLEALGQNAELRTASTDRLMSEALKADLDLEVQEALANRDQDRLKLLLGANSNVCCLIAPAKDDEDDDSAPNDDEIRQIQQLRRA
jgi:hypothetical protein